jgi:hypothetical protein
MANMTKNVVVGSMGVAGLVAVAAIVDMIFGFPFAGLLTMDITFLVGAAMVIYMGWDSYRDLR